MKHWMRGALMMSVLTMVVACGDDGGSDGDGGDGGDGDSGTPGTYAEVQAILLEGSCASAGCHGPLEDTLPPGDFPLHAGDDLVALLVNQPACEAPELDLVEPGDPASSWLYIKLTAEAETTGLQPGKLVAQDSWGTPAPAGTCAQAAGFGRLMPTGATSTSGMLDAEDLRIIRTWIEAGAPGPDGQ